MYEIITIYKSDGSVSEKLVMFVDEAGLEWRFPMDESNSDYQAYLAWVEENK